jgi:antitoxin MazE
MKVHELIVCRIGNSRGIRIPSRLIKKYGITKTVLAEEQPDELVLRATRSKKLSWEETFKEMAVAKETWHDFDTVAADGLNEL